MEKFYSRVSQGNLVYPLERTGHIIYTNSNMFGIYKNKYNDFDIIDLNTGLSVNYLNLYKLKDIKANINRYDEKLNSIKTGAFYQKCCDEWVQMLNKK